MKKQSQFLKTETNTTTYRIRDYVSFNVFRLQKNKAKQSQFQGSATPSWRWVKKKTLLAPTPEVGVSLPLRRGFPRPCGEANRPGKYPFFLIFLSQIRPNTHYIPRTVIL